MKSILEDWSIPEFRLYRAIAPQQGCSNLSEVETDDFYCESRYNDQWDTFPGIVTREFIEGVSNHWKLSLFENDIQLTQTFSSYPLHSGSPESEEFNGTTSYTSCDYLRDNKENIHSYGLSYVYNPSESLIVRENREEGEFKYDLESFFYVSKMNLLDYPYRSSYKILKSTNNCEEIVFVNHDDYDETFNSQIYWIRIIYLDERAVILIHSILVNRPSVNYDIIKDFNEDWSFHNQMILH